MARPFAYNSGSAIAGTATEDLYLGNYHAGVQNARTFDGKIAEFYVHEGDFGAANVTTLFNSTKTRFGY